MIHIDLMYLSMISVLAPTVLGIALYRTLTKELKILTVFVVATCILEAGVYVSSRYNINNMVAFHLFTYLEFGAVSLIYYHLFRFVRVIRYGIMMSGIIFLALSIYGLFNWEYIDQYNTLQRALEHSIILIYTFVFLVLFFKRLPKEKYLLRPYLYLTLGWCIYFAGTFLVFLDAHSYVDFDDFFNWSVHSVLNIFLNAIYFAALWTGGKMVRGSSNKN